LFTIANVRPVGQNVGNQAIHFSLKHLVNQAFGRLVSIIDYPSSRLPGDSGVCGITRESVNEMNRFADGVIVGGGNLFENGSLLVDTEALGALNPPLMLFSNSWGRTYDRFDNLQERSDSISSNDLHALVTRADISLSRDSATHNLLGSMGLIDELGLCPTIGLSNFSASFPPLPPGEEVGALISIRTPQLMNVSARHQRRIPDIIDTVIDQLRAAGFQRVRVLCNDKRDLDFATLFKQSKQVDTVFTSDVYEYLSTLSNADFLFSFRLHATLPAISLGVPVVNVSYDERASSLISDLGVEAADINLIEKGDVFEEAVKEKISAGGFRSDASLEKKWEQGFKNQAVAMGRFRSLVVDYLTSETSLAKL